MVLAHARCEDTNKNLKFVHVFPKLTAQAAPAVHGEAEEAPRVAKTPEELLLESFGSKSKCLAVCKRKGWEGQVEVRAHLKHVSVVF